MLAVEICVSAVAAKVSGLGPADVETRGTENFLVQEFYACSRNSKLGPAPVIAWSNDSWGKFGQKGRYPQNQKNELVSSKSCRGVDPTTEKSKSGSAG